MGRYTDTVLDHFDNPRNVGVLEDADAVGEAGSAADGDAITVYVRVREGRLERVTFQAFGCPAAIASGSMVTVLACAKTLEQAEAIQDTDVAEALGGLPSAKLDCSNIGAQALRNAIAAYRSATGSGAR